MAFELSCCLSDNGTANPNGLRLLVATLLEHVGLSACCATAAQQLLAVDDLWPLRARPLFLQQPLLLSFWHSEVGGGILVTLLDLSGDTGIECSLDLPSLVLGGCAQYFMVSRWKVATGAHTAMRSAQCANPEDHIVPEVFSRRELVSGQLHARVPARGLVCLRIKPAAYATNEPAHLLSSLRRLARRPRQYAVHNDAAEVLRSCRGYDEAIGAAHLRGLSQTIELSGRVHATLARAPAPT